jgi:MtN3 and saliva related transmembrane protein
MFTGQTELLGLTAGICTSLSLLPQLVKILKHKKSDDISLFYLIILFIGICLWIWYGFLRDDVPIIATNSFTLLINSLIIIAGIHYKRRSQK